MAKQYDDSGYFGSRLRTWRHSPCAMQPLSLGFFCVFLLFGLVTLALQVPTLLLGLVLGPILQRNSWYVEFLYPWDVARWGHFFLMRRSNRSKASGKNRGFHSRTLEQRIEVVPGRVYVHPIPQFLDNLGWLVVCLPPPPTAEVQTNPHHTTRITVENAALPLLGFLIDCGDAPECHRAIEEIRKFHYHKRSIRIPTILSTHKHHDHTGGNRSFWNHAKSPVAEADCRIYAGAAERVPGRTDALRNGDRVVLPSLGEHDANALLEVEAVAVPAHTRGSLVYRMAVRMPGEEAAMECLFTGDTLFSGGGGVPFEADTGTETEREMAGANGNTPIRPNRGTAATERCFAELVHRAAPRSGSLGDVLVFPGHEYTQELLSRQFSAAAAAASEACRWKNLAPQEFFVTAQELYVALHRRSLPSNSGRLLMVPSTLAQQTILSPHYRSLRRSAELVVRALDFWNEHFAKDPVPAGWGPPQAEEQSRKEEDAVAPPPKTPSTAKQWTIDAAGLRETAFTTVYTADLASVAAGLEAGELSPHEAAAKLRAASRRLEEPVVNRRAIPGCLPSDKTVYRGIRGLVLLGSPPSALTIGDARAMGMPAPIDSNSDQILVCRDRLCRVLARLGIPERDRTAEIARRLWGEAAAYSERGDPERDAARIELGVLKWVLYGVPANQPSWFATVCCLPCSSPKVRESFGNPRLPAEHKARTTKTRSGDLVSHDVLTCALCRSATGRALCPEATETATTTTTTTTTTNPPPYHRQSSSFGTMEDEGGVELGVGGLLLPLEHG